MALIEYPAKETILGINANGRLITCQDDAKHVYVCGTTGSGKTVLLSNFIESGINKGYGMLIIDGKGDTGQDSILDILTRFTSKYSRKLNVVDIGNPPESAKYNPFKNAQETIIKDMLVNMTDWSEMHYKTNTERYIQRLSKLLRLSNITLSFNSIIGNLRCTRFQTLSSQLSKAGIITKEEHVINIEIAESSGKVAENAAARFATIAESEAGTIFNDDNGIDIYTALSKKEIVLFILNPLLYPELSPAFGRLVLIDAKQAVSRFFKENTERKYFIFDEANAYASPVLIDLINKSRSASVTVVVSTQSLADLEAAAGDPFKQQIIENCNNYIVLRQNSAKSAEEWAKILGTREAMQMTFQIGQKSSRKTESSGGYGSARKTREFIYHPDEIKSLKTGNAIYLSKDTGTNSRIRVRKPF